MRKKDSGYGSQGLLKPEVMEMVLLCITKAILQKATTATKHQDLIQFATLQINAIAVAAAAKAAELRSGDETEDEDETEADEATASVVLPSSPRIRVDEEMAARFYEYLRKEDEEDDRYQAANGQHQEDDGDVEAVAFTAAAEKKADT